MQNNIFLTLLFSLFSLLLLFTLTACSPFYVIRAAYEESKILLNKEPITEILAKDTTDPVTAKKLRHVLQARDFTTSLFLEAGDSYTEFTQLDRDTLAWVLLASQKTSFSLYTWWYPIVGSVPYKGFFDKEDALSLTKRLEKKGYETWLRKTAAFSTLGWFNDPLLSTTLKSTIPSIVNTVIHEIFHANIWLPGSVDFNESAANFVGIEGSVQYFQQLVDKCDSLTCREEELSHLQSAKKIRDFEYELAKTLKALHEDLTSLYTSSRSEEEKIRERDHIFQLHIPALREKYPKMTILQTLNNAALMQLYLYRKDLHIFRSLFAECSSDWQCFYKKAVAQSEKMM